MLPGMTGESFTATAIIVAAGMGVRMGAGLPKALMPVGGRPLLAWSAAVLGDHPRVTRLVVVAPPGHEATLMGMLPDCAAQVAVVPGGESRAHSVALGLEAADPAAPVVLVHDAARPLVRASLVDAVLDAVAGADGALAAAPLADTLKRVEGDDGLVTATPVRDGLWLAQTPQAVVRDVFVAAVRAAVEEDRLHAATDCASLVEAAGGRMRVVANPEPNPKVTTPGDVAIAEMLLALVR